VAAVVVTLMAIQVPANAAVVNGTSITQATLNADLSAIANSPDYQCYLNANQAVLSNGQSTLPPIHGAGGNTGAYSMPFVIHTLDQSITEQVVFQLAAERNTVITTADTANAKTDLTSAINSTLSAVTGSQFACQGVTADSIYASLPPSFVDDIVHVQAASEAIASSEPGSGVTTADIQRYFDAHRKALATTCVTLIPSSTQAAAQQIVDQVHSGTDFGTLAAQAGNAQQGCSNAAASQVIADVADVPVGEISGVINYPSSGQYLVVQVNQRTPASLPAAANVVRGLLLQHGQPGAEAAILAATHRAEVAVNPQYGRWTPASATIGIVEPLTPPASSVLNPAANEAYPPNTPPGG